MKPVETEAEFHAAVEESLQKIPALQQRYPDRRDVIAEVELQLDIMRRRTANGCIPTQLERDRITMYGLLRYHFPVRVRTLATLPIFQRLEDLAWAYQNWEEIKP